MEIHRDNKEKSIEITRYDALEEYMTPEMLRTPLHELALSIRYLNVPNPDHFQNSQASPPWLCWSVPLEVHGAAPH